MEIQSGKTHPLDESIHGANIWMFSGSSRKRKDVLWADAVLSGPKSPGDQDSGQVRSGLVPAETNTVSQ